MSTNGISGVTVSLLISSATYIVSSRDGLIRLRNMKIAFLLFYYVHSIQAQKKDNVFEWSDMSTQGLLFQ